MELANLRQNPNPAWTALVTTAASCGRGRSVGEPRQTAAAFMEAAAALSSVRRSVGLPKA